MSEKSGARGAAMPGALARGGRAALAVCLALLCLPAAALRVASEWTVQAWAAEEQPVYYVEVPVTGDGAQDDDERIGMFFTVVDSDEKAVTVGRGDVPEGVDVAAGDYYAISAEYDGTLSIPSSVSINNEWYKVVGIQDNAFGYASAQAGTDGPRACAITGISIPCTVQTIGAAAFGNCASLESVEFLADDNGNTSLTSIGDNAFRSCSALKGVSVPKTVQTIGQYAFWMDGNIETLVFETDEQGDSALTTLGDSAFSLGTTEQTSVEGHLESVVLPASLETVPQYLFSCQNALKRVEFAGESIGKIGIGAFRYCTSLEYIDIPELTDRPTDMQMNNLADDYCIIATSAFQGDAALATIVFRGDMADVPIASRQNPAFDGCTGIQTVVYWGSPASYNGAQQGQGNNNDGLSVDADTPYFDSVAGAAVTYYYNVTFAGTPYVNDEGETVAPVISSARIRDDVTVADIKNQLANPGSAILAVGAQIFDDGGALPNSDYASSVWAFDVVDGGVLTTSCVAWIPDVVEGQSIDIRSARISVNATTFVTAQQPISLTYQALDPAGTTPLVEGVDFQIGIQVLDDNGEWRADGSLSLDSIQDAGTYRILFQGIGDYTETATVEIKVVAASVAFAGSNGYHELLYEGNEAAQLYRYTPFEDYQVTHGSGTLTTATTTPLADFGILVNQEDAQSATMALWLSSALGAPIVLTNADSLPTYAMSSLRQTVKQNGTVLCLGNIDQSVKSYVESWSNGFTTISFNYDGAASGAAQIYRLFTNSGTESGTTAYVVASSNAAYGVVAGMAAYGEKDPIFFCGDDGTLDPYTRYVLKTGGFSNIVMVGADGISTSLLEQQVSNSAIKFTTLEGDPEDLSMQMALQYFSDHPDAVDAGVVFASTSDCGGSVAAVACMLAESAGCPLVLGSSTDELAAQAESLLSESVVVRTSTVHLVCSSSDGWEAVKTAVNSCYGVVEESDEGDDDA